MGYECRDDPQGAIQSLLTYSGSIRILNMSSTLIGRSFPRPKLVVDVVGACMDTIFSRQNYRSSLLRKSFFRGARDVGRRSVWRFSGHLDFFRFPHFPIQTQCSFLLYTKYEWAENILPQPLQKFPMPSPVGMPRPATRRMPPYRRTNQN